MAEPQHKVVVAEQVSVTGEDPRIFGRGPSGKDLKPDPAHRDQFVSLRNFKVYFTPEAHMDLNCAVKITRSELTVYGDVSILGGGPFGDGDFLVEKILIPDQDVNEVETIATVAGKLLLEKDLKSKRPEGIEEHVDHCMRFYWHLHTSTSSQASHQDDDTLRQWLQAFPWFIRAIANKGGTMDVWVVSVQAGIMRKVQWDIYYPEQYQREQRMRKLLAKKLNYVPPKQGFASLHGRSRTGMLDPHDEEDDWGAFDPEFFSHNGQGAGPTRRIAPRGTQRVFKPASSPATRTGAGAESENSDEGKGSKPKRRTSPFLATRKRNKEKTARSSRKER